MTDRRQRVGEERRGDSETRTEAGIYQPLLFSSLFVNGPVKALFPRPQVLPSLLVQLCEGRPCYPDGPSRALH